MPQGSADAIDLRSPTPMREANRDCTGGVTVRRLNSSSNSFADERGLDFAMERRDVTVAKPCEQACCPPACRSGRRHGDFLRSGVDVKTRSPGLSPKPLL